MISWKYVAPAFVVPFVFTLDPRGMAVLMQAPLLDVLWVSAAAVVGVCALSAGIGGWMRGRATALERAASVAAAVMLFVPRPVATVAGLALAGATIAAHWIRTSARPR
jgi:TRAP-type uncharacterized transport system fused permease subunit